MKIDPSNLQLQINFIDSDLDPEERDEEARKLLNYLQELDEVEEVDRVRENPPEGSKALGGFLVGMITAQVKPKNIKGLMKFLGDRLGAKPIEMTVKTPDGRELSIKASSREEFEFAMQKAEEFLVFS